jgi:hypothetical protein
MLHIKEVETKKEFNHFLKLPYKIHANHENWVPPLLLDEKMFFDKNVNPAFKNDQTILLIAYKDSKPVGRIMGIIKKSGKIETAARFGFMDTFDDLEVYNALMERIEEWVKSFGYNKIIGPYGFSDQDPEGYIIEGYEHEVTIATNYNFPWVIDYLERRGYTKEIDYVVYQIDVANPIPELFLKINDRLIERGEYTFLEFKKKKELKPYADKMMQVMNETYVHLFGYEALDEAESKFLIKRFWDLIDPRFIKAVEKDGDFCGFLISIPNLSEGFKKAKGRLLPFGIFHLLKAGKNSKQCDLLIAGTRDIYKNKGLDVWGMVAIIDESKKAGYKYIDSHHELETNYKVRAEMEKFGGRLIKKFRVYQKELLN